MAYIQTTLMHRSLTDEEEAEFRAYAEANDPPDLANWNLYHPVSREVWVERGIVPPTEAANALTGEMEPTSTGGQWADLQSETEAIDGDQVL